jgi:hypothetical protein
VLAVILLIVVLVLIATAGIVTWIRRAAGYRRIIEAPAGKLEDLVYGDVMCKAVLTSGSLGRLEIHDWGVRLRGMALSRWIVPTWEARYDELAIAELVALQHSRRAVWFRLRGTSDGIGFLSNRSEDVLRQLEQHGVPVNRALTQYRQVAELYRAPR